MKNIKRYVTSNLGFSTYLIGPFRKELSMFFELVACDALPSIYFERLIDEFKPPAVD